MSTAPSRRNRRHRSARRRGWLIAVGVILAVIVTSLAWIVVRGLSARDELMGALPIAAEIRASLASGDSDIAAEVADLQRRTQSARASTNDPIWAAYEWVPVLGQNLTAFREAADVVDDIARDALPPLTDLADQLTLASLTPRDGGIALQPLVDARPALRAAADVLVVADERAASINTAGTIGQIDSAVDQLVALIAETASVVSGLDSAAELLPPMLGVEGERTYLLLFLNNAELRAAGGIPGAVATVTVDNGRLDLAEQTSASSLGYFDPAPVVMTDEEAAIFALPVDRYLQNVTATPDFARTAEIAQGMWAERTGQVVDGVIGVDVGALGLILKATGPIDLGGGDTISSENSADLLLSEVYARFERPADQDAYFAAVAARIFDTVTDLEVDPAGLVESLATAVEQQSISVWSADDAEQQRLVDFDLDGGLPEGADDDAVFGFYVNDSTGAKMSYYLDYSVAVAQATCRLDGRPTTATTIRLRSVAPADAAVSLSPYVTGGGGFGVPPGDIRNNLHLYLPAGENVFDVRDANGDSISFGLAEHDGRVVVSKTIDLSPGATGEFTVYSNGLAEGIRRVSIEHTPSVRDVPIATDLPLDCLDVRSTPGQVADALGMPGARLS